MQPIEEFMREYFDTKAELQAAWMKHSAPFREKFYTSDYAEEVRDARDKIGSEQKAQPPAVSSAKIYDESAEVVTSEFLGNRRQQFRYFLKSSGDRWLIQRQDWQCFLCKGTGRKGEAACQICGGAGWKNYGPSDT